MSSGGETWQRWPNNKQLCAADAARVRFNTLLDLVPADDAPFLLPVHPDADARRAMSYRQLHQLAQAVRSSPALAGLTAGARVAACLPNGPEAASCFMALAGSYAFAPLNLNLCAQDMEFELGNVPAAAVIVLASVPGPGAAARAAAVSLGIRIIELLPDADICGLFSLQGCGQHTEGVVSGSADSCAQVPATTTSGRDALALVMHTSGTTRRPKVVPLTHGQLGIGALCAASTLQLRRDAVAINLMPLFHLHGLMVNVLVTAVSGARVMCAPRFDAPLFFRWLQPALCNARKANESGLTDEGFASPAPTWYSAVPTIHQEVLRYAESQLQRTGRHPPHSLQLVRNCSGMGTFRLNLTA